MKAIYINDYQYNFEIFDKSLNSKTSYEFKADRPITFLDLRKIEIASIIKGKIVCNHREIEEQLEKLHTLNSSKVGTLVNSFSLFSNSLDTYVKHLDSICWTYLTEISETLRDFPIDEFLITELEKNEFLSRTIKGFYTYYRGFELKKIITIRDLVNLTRTELLKVRNIGITRADEIEGLLKKHGLHLKSE